MGISVKGHLMMVWLLQRGLYPHQLASSRVCNPCHSSKEWVNGQLSGRLPRSTGSSPSNSSEDHKPCLPSTNDFRRREKGGMEGKGQTWSKSQAGWVPRGAGTASCLPSNGHKHSTLTASTATPSGRYYDHLIWRNWGTESLGNLLEVTQPDVRGTAGIQTQCSEPETIHWGFSARFKVTYH